MFMLSCLKYEIYLTSNSHNVVLPAILSYIYILAGVVLLYIISLSTCEIYCNKRRVYFF